MSLSPSEKNQIPNFSNFDPSFIPFQDELVDDVLCNWDYEANGAYHALCSGAVGSSKSIVAAHLAVRHCLTWHRAKVMLAREALPDLRETIFSKVEEQIEGCNVAKKVKRVSKASCRIEFINGSVILSRTCHDKNYTKVRSLELSAIVFEEAIEFAGDHKIFIMESLNRLGRLRHIRENWALFLTNPPREGPGHWLYDHFELALDEGTGIVKPRSKPTKRVYYSITDDNPFLTDQYKAQLKEDLSKREYEIMGKGRWLRIAESNVYYAYTEANERDEDYVVDEDSPIYVAFDFNIGDGKPFSLCLYQYIKGEFLYFDEVIIEGLRTLDACDELAARGLLDYNTTYIIQGDATGRARSTQSLKSNYAQIEEFFANFERLDGNPMRYEMNVPLSNPPVRSRHTLANAAMESADGVRTVFCYPGVPTLRKGFRNVQLKPGGQYIEREDYYQHVTTAATYGIVATLKKARQKRSTTRVL